MYSNLFSLVLATLYLTSSASPLPSPLPAIVAISRTGNSDITFVDGPDLIRRTYLKYGAVPPPTLPVRATVNGTVTSTPTQYDTIYLLPASIGSPSPATYTVSFDTSSSDISIYAPKLGAAGSTISTKVTIGGVGVSNQPVKLNSDSTGGSNTVGMSYTGKSFYADAVNQLVISPVFTANLNKGKPGTYTLGYIDSTAYKGAITYATVDPTNGFWQFTSNGYAVGSTGSFVTLATKPIVDTDTTLIYLPQSVNTAYYKQVNGAVYDNTQGGYTFPCSTTLPDLQVGVGSYRAIVPGSYINYGPLTSGGSTCFGGLQPDTDIGVSILGLVFIKSQYVVFKGVGTSGLSVGFAKKA